MTSLARALRIPAGPVDLTAIDPAGHPAYDGKKAAGEQALADLGPELADLQERLYANKDSGRSVLLVLQGMDTSGKGGVLEHTVGLVSPAGLKVTSFKAPTEEERQHDFLWRIEKALPGPGMIGVFDRSHYEDVLIARVRRAGTPCRDRAALRTRSTSSSSELADNGTTIVKCMLHISAEEQKERLLARLDDPTKHWKFNPGTSTSVPSGRRTARPTRSPSSAPTPSPLLGTSSPATTSGTATSPSGSCCWRRCGG
jgi:polyphosphate kinase 2 (PPK2 family)